MGPAVNGYLIDSGKLVGHPVKARVPAGILLSEAALMVGVCSPDLRRTS